MFELWISEPWDADPRVLRGCLRPLRSGDIGLFTLATGEYILHTRYVGDRISLVYGDIPVTVNVDKLIHPYTEVWSVVERLSTASHEGKRNTQSILEPFGIGTLVLTTGWTTLAFMEAYEQAFKAVATSLRLDPPRKICEEAALLVYQGRDLAVVVKMVRDDLSLSFFLTRPEPHGVWHGLATERITPSNLLTPKEWNIWQSTLESCNPNWRDVLNEEFQRLLQERDVEAVQRHFQYNAGKDALLLSKFGSEIFMRARNRLGLPPEGMS